MDDSSLRIPQPPLGSTPVVVQCGCQKEKFSWLGFFGKVFLSISAFVLASFMPFIILFALFVMLVIGVAASAESTARPDSNALETEFVYGSEGSRDKLLEIPIQGIILGEHSDGTDFASILYGGITYGSDVKEYLRKVEKDADIKGVVLLINSPGGTVHGADMIGNAIKEFRATAKKPIYAHVTGLGASGAYWSAVQTEKIYADSGSLTGSIGVIMGSVLFYNQPTSVGDSFGGSVDTRGGIEEFNLSVGKGKDFGNPFRRPSEEELNVYRSSLEREYSRFVEVVNQGRGIESELLRSEIGAFVYDNAKAEEYRLIDGTQYREATYEQLADTSGIEGEYQVVRVGETGLFAQLFAQSRALFPGAKTTVADVVKGSELCLPKSVVVFYGDVSGVCN